MTKVIIVSPAEFHAYFSQVYPKWDLQHVVEDIPQMWSDLESGKLSNQSEIVIFNDFFFDEDSNDLEAAIATFAPAALVIVLSYDTDLEYKIKERVAELCKANKVAESKFYFAHEETPIEDINAAIEHYNRYKKAPASHPAGEVVHDGTPLAASQPELVTIGKLREEKGSILTNVDLPPLTQRGVIVASTSSKGGSGKTTVALCTASMLYHSSRLAVEQGLRDAPLRVCVVDMDVRDGQIGFLLNQTKPTILNLYIEEKHDPSIEAIRNNLVEHKGMGIYALLAPKFGRTASVLKNDFYQDVIFKLTTIFDVVILDTSVNYLDRLLGEVVLPIADKIFFVTNLSKGSIFGMTRWMQEMVANKDVETHVEASKVGVIINQAMADVGVDLELITKQAMDVPLVAAIPSDSAAVVKATNTYTLQDIVLYHPEISEQYFRIAKKIIDIVPKDDAFIVSPQTGKIHARDELKDRLIKNSGGSDNVYMKPSQEEQYSVAPEGVVKAKKTGLFK